MSDIKLRVDGGDSKTPLEQRVYVFVKAGYGENARIARTRREYQYLSDKTIRTYTEEEAASIQEVEAQSHY
jgi:hypothetical protein